MICNKVSGQLPPEENCPPVRAGFSVKVRVSFRVGGNQTIAPQINCTLVRVRVWVSFGVGGAIVLEPCNNACNKDEMTLFSVMYDLWFHEFVMLKPTLNWDNLMILDFIIDSLLLLTNACFKALLFLWYFFFWFRKCRKHDKNNTWNTFSPCFFTNYLKLVNLIPGLHLLKELLPNF